MGCDIHAHIEIKIKGKDHWIHWNQASISRDYSLFEKMAGVRGSLSNAIYEPKGFPDDATEGTKLDYEQWGEDAHTPGYLNLKEIAEVEKWYGETYPGIASWNFSKQLGWLFGNTFGGYFEFRHDYPEYLEDARIVFWFDC